jgi:predicted neutral ceramidase superfamily lipid hydrolase
MIIFGYVFVYTEQKIGILGNKRLMYLVLFSLIVLEVFFTLNYFLISPLSKSLIIATISYVFIGFCYTVLAKHTDNSIKTYLVIAGIMITIILSTSIWGIGI